PKDFWINAFIAATLQGEAQKDPVAAMEAVGFCRLALATRPQSFGTQNLLGVLLDYANKLPEAEQAFRQATELNPKSSMAFTNLGNQVTSTQAAAAYDKAIQLQPYHVPAYVRLARALELQKKLPEAEQALRQAIQLNPTFAPAYSGLGGVLERQGKLAQAEEA